MPTSLPAEPSRSAFPDDWRWHHAHAATSLDDVERLFPGRFDLASVDRAGVDAAAATWGMRATPYYLDLARSAGRDDPIWALSVPSGAETVVLPEERTDPIGDELPRNRPHPALTRRYVDRVLLHPTPVCSVHCRHCFRKRVVGRAEAAPGEAELEDALRWIDGEGEVHEVILTGGDPLTLSDERLLRLATRLDGMDHVWSLRIHTRMPVVNPFRITDALANGLGALETPTRVVTHFNHPREVTADARRAVARLRAAAVEVLNQAVLLAGVNDDPGVHRELLWALLRARVLPYALHHADLVPGTSHLRTGVETGHALLRALRGTVPGYAIPRYLLDLPEGVGKVPLDYPWVTPGVLGGLRVEAPDGTFHDYGGAAARPR